MIELRTLVRNSDGSRVLQYRMAVAVDASGAFCPGEWTEWMMVPEVMEGKLPLYDARFVPQPKQGNE